MKQFNRLNIYSVILIFALAFVACEEEANEANTVETEYHVMVIGADGFDFSAKKSNGNQNDVRIVIGQPNNNKSITETQPLWFFNSESDTQNGLHLQKNYGNVSVEELPMTVPTWDNPVKQITVGNSYFLKCQDGYVKLQVLSIDSAQINRPDLSYPVKIKFYFQ